jgi:hypothetical protein
MTIEYSNLPSDNRSASRFSQNFKAYEEKEGKVFKYGKVSLMDSIEDDATGDIYSYLSVYQEDSLHFYRYFDVVTISNNDHATDDEYVLLCAVGAQEMSAFILLSPPEAFYSMDEDNLEIHLFNTCSCIITGVIYFLIVYYKKIYA